jgi:hypothetical protein
MTDPITPPARMTRVAHRISSSSGSPLAPPKASPCVLELLGQARHQAHPAMETGI